MFRTFVVSFMNWKKGCCGRRFSLGYRLETFTSQKDSLLFFTPREHNKNYELFPRVRLRIIVLQKVDSLIPQTYDLIFFFFFCIVSNSLVTIWIETSG